MRLLPARQILFLNSVNVKYAPGGIITISQCFLRHFRIDHFAKCKQHWSRDPVSDCNCFLYFTCEENVLKMFVQLFDSVLYVLLVVFYPSFNVVLKKLKQEVLLDQCCLHLAKWSTVGLVSQTGLRLSQE